MSTTFNSLMTAILMNTTGKVLTALDVGFVTYKGSDVMLNQFVRWLHSKMGDISQDTLQLLYISGFGEYLNWTISGMAFGLSIKSASYLTARLRSN